MNMLGGFYRRIYSGIHHARRLNSVSMEAECWFWRIVARADDYGSIVRDPQLLRSDISPRREISLNKAESLTLELEKIGLLMAYSVGGESYIQVADWDRWQPAPLNGRRIRRYPPPEPIAEGGESGGTRMNPEEPGGTRMNPVDIRALTPSEHHQSINTKHTPLTRSVLAEVDAIYAAYPRRVGKGAARKAIAKALTKIAAPELLAAIREYAASPYVRTADPRYIPHPATWMNQERWNDDRSQWTRTADTPKRGPYRAGEYPD